MIFDTGSSQAKLFRDRQVCRSSGDTRFVPTPRDLTTAICAEEGCGAIEQASRADGATGVNEARPRRGGWTARTARPAAAAAAAAGAGAMHSSSEFGTWSGMLTDC